MKKHLKREDFATPCWRHLVSGITDMIALRKTLIENTKLDYDSTQVLRGEIKALRKIQSLADPGLEPESDDLGDVNP